MNETLVECRGLSKVFSSTAENLHVIQDLDLQVARASRVAITGASGCGKSTLLSLIGGLDRPSGGQLLVDGQSIENLAERDLTEYRSKTVGFVFQFHYLLKDFTALENVALPAYIGGQKKSTAFERAAQLLKDMGLGERLQHLPMALSGGERQRAAIARALINQPRVVLADEPTGNLDPASATQVRELLFGLSEHYGSTLILVTHDTNFAAQADYRYALENGKLRLC